MDSVIARDKTAPELWQSCLDQILPRVKRQTFHTWFKPIRALEFANGTLKLEVANQFALDWIKQHFRGLIEEAVKSVSGVPVQIEFCVGQRNGGSDRHTATSNVSGVNSAKSDAGAREDQVQYRQENRQDFRPQRPGAAIGLRLSERYTFDSFVVGDSNNFAHAAALAVADGGGRPKFNPLYMYGKVGLGKTHLA